MSLSMEVRENFGCQSSTLTLFETALFFSTEYIRLAGPLPPISTRDHWDYRYTLYCIWLCVSSVNLNSGPHACVTRALTHGTISLALELGLLLLYRREK